MSAAATYVYCIIQDPKTPSLARLPPGLAGASRPRLLPVEKGLWLVVCDAPLALYGEEAIDAGLKDMDWVSEVALAHEAVIEHFAKVQALVPMKLFTLFHSDARALEDLTQRRAPMLRVLERVAGCQEWGVRVSFDDARAIQAATQAGAGAATKGTASGASFLLRKKQLRDVAQEVSTRAHAHVDEVFHALEKKAREARRRAPTVDGVTSARLLLDAAYLLPTKQVTSFRAEVKAIQRKLPAGYDLTLTGPWPAYNFIAEAEPPAPPATRRASSRARPSP